MSERAGKTAAEMALHEDVMAELLSCYGEGEDTDWPYLNDLADLIVSMVEKRTELLNAALLLACRDGWSEEADKAMEHYSWKAERWLTDGRD